MRKNRAHPGDLFRVTRENRILGAVYIGLLLLALLPYLLMVVLQPEGYNPGVYRNAYLYFMVFDFILFSILVPFWKIEGLESGEPVGFLNLLAGMIVLSLSSIPLIFTIFLMTRLNPCNFLLPLCMKIVWGMAVLSLKSLICALKPGWRWSHFAVVIFIFAILVLGSILAFCFVQYQQAVITTIYDRDIVAVFFLNPLLALAGLVYSQTGGGSQMGAFPFYAAALFWGLVSVVLYYGCGRVAVSSGRQNDHE